MAPTSRPPPPAVLPRPRNLDVAPGVFHLGPGTAIRASPGAGGVAELLRRLLAPATALPLPITGLAQVGGGAGGGGVGRGGVAGGGGPVGAGGGPVGAGGGIDLVIEDRLATLGPEGYRLVVSPDGAGIRACSPAGLAHGVQTLRQLLPPAVFRHAPVAGEPWVAPCVEIEDAPRFSWRGGHLDTARHFLPLSFLLRYVDLLAVHKLNVLHLHLTDDQGWRLPSRRYPRLTEVGSWRRESMAGHHSDLPSGSEPGGPSAGGSSDGGSSDGGSGRRSGGEPGPRFDGIPHGGHYSVDDLRELVAYAAERFVTVVPEVDLPGHTQAAIAAYPGLGNRDVPPEVGTEWGVSDHVLNLEDDTLAFCRHVLTEVVDLFPSVFVHTGGDECPTTEWRASRRAEERVRALGLGGVEEIQSWYTHRLADVLTGAGRRLVGWDETLEGGLPPGAVVMSWRGEEGGVAAARAGHDVVMTPERRCYFDHYQSDDPDEPLAIGGCTTLQDVYGYDPVPPDLAGDPEAQAHVLGTQFQVWTEYLPSAEAVEYMAFPRACALAEVAWSEDHGDFSDFSERLRAHIGRLDSLGVNYRPLEGPRPWQRGGTGLRRRRAALPASRPRP
ncbi:MAG: beta-N-acetylhexosaminidase [Acidimicrobiales bacterium]